MASVFVDLILAPGTPWPVEERLSHPFYGAGKVKIESNTVSVQGLFAEPMQDQVTRYLPRPHAHGICV